MRPVWAVVLVAANCMVVRTDDCARIPIWRDGHRDGAICSADAAELGLTVLDLGDDWVPHALDGEPSPGYRATYLALARERFDDAGADGVLAKRDRYLELYGIEPTLEVVHGRLADDARHRCHAAIDDTALAAGTFSEEPRAAATARLARVKGLRADLEHERIRRHLADLATLATTNAYDERRVALLAELEGYIATVRAVQAHLACDHLFESPPVGGGFTWQTSEAVESFQRGTMILPTGTIDASTREALELDSREHDFRTTLRVLRARVVAATGLIEDGTAGSGEALVLGRALEPAATWRTRGYAPLADAAPDLIDAATEAAAKALGWYDATSTLAFLSALESPESPSRLVAVWLPPIPRYHTTAMALGAKIDRGDVWRAGSPRSRELDRRPALTLYTADGEHRIPLVRWPTTIGGWQDQQIGGAIVRRWKESPVGPRVWRDLYIGPTWLPPETTPDRELMRGGALAREQFGPSYRAAFGFLAFVHLAEEHEHGKLVLEDEGIRTHATGNLPSLANGVSHGCHRLLGMHAVRLADFVLAHHDHVVRGDEPTYYRRVVDDTFTLAINTLGYRIELVPPIPVEVLDGTVHR